MKPISAWHIISYPRSGNHLVRGIVEAYSKRPTEGCFGITSDPPIYQNKSNKDAIISIKSDVAIGYKAHFLREIHARDLLYGRSNLGMILITRNPADAIASQCVRILSQKRERLFLTKRKKRILVQNEIDSYLALLFRFASHKKEMKVHLKYESLISPETSKQTIVELLSVLNVELTGPPIEKVLQITKSSQVSVGSRFPLLKDEIRSEVQSQLSYSDVLSYITS